MKQAIVIRTDLHMSTGKLAVQACHASVAAVLCAGADVLRSWDTDGQTKIALAVDSLRELETLKAQCEAMEIIHALIADAGRTEWRLAQSPRLPSAQRKTRQLTGSLALFHF